LSSTLASPTDSITDALDLYGWASSPHFLAPADASALSRESRAAWDEGEFRRARVGRDDGLVIREDIRRDHVMWLRPGETTLAQGQYLASIEDLRLALNARFFLGLFDFEGHFAVYPEGAFYKPHLDRHQNTSARVVTAILYLNENWEPGDGGELKIWTTPGDRSGPFEITEPRLGKLVTFFAADHWHEVLPAKKTRMSITGWFRVRA
jgi:SM-20-related protein